jgi:aminopeptidase N
MNLLKVFRFFLLAVLFSTFPLTLFAQNSTPNFNRSSNFDIQHYIIRVSFDAQNKKVFGDTTVQLRPVVANFTQIELDAVGLNFESVKLEPENYNLQFRTANDKVYVSLNKAYTPENLISVRFKYTATPKKGVYFVNELKEGNDVTHSAQIWTQGEPDEARHWIPSFDFPTDKATSEEIVTVSKGETVIGNGELVEQKENADNTSTFHYKTDVPHSIYLVSLVIGKYVRINDKFGEIPLGFYVYPGKEDLAQKAFGRTKDIMRVYEELTGIPFPYKKYDQTIVASFAFGGMENITATTLADEEVFFAEINPRITGDLVSHELAHSWFGNLVTCKNWAELWLNESFATYMEAAFREKMYGREDYMWKVTTDAQAFIAYEARGGKKHGLYNLQAENLDKLFDTSPITYNKGGAVLHILRETIGDKAFWKGVNLYLTRHKFGNVETADLQKAMEESSGKSLDWFFKQWIYGTGHPKIEVSQIYNLKSKTLKLTVNQVQKAEELTPSAFILPLEIEIKAGNELKKEKLDVKNRTEVFSFKLKTKPSEIIFDKGGKIPLARVKINDLKVN